MTNEEIKNYVENYRFGSCMSVSEEMWHFIFDNYTQVDRDAVGKNKWYKVYKLGNDAKYGHIMICPTIKQWRYSTFSEFYSGGVVD